MSYKRAFDTDTLNECSRPLRAVRLLLLLSTECSLVGVDVNEPNAHGTTVLHIAAQNGRAQIAELLVEHRFLHSACCVAHDQFLRTGQMCTAKRRGRGELLLKWRLDLNTMRWWICWLMLVQAHRCEEALELRRRGVPEGLKGHS